MKKAKIENNQTNSNLEDDHQPLTFTEELDRDPLYLNKVEEAGEKLGLSRGATYALINNGTLAAVKIGGGTRVPNSAIAKCIRNLEPYPIEPALKARSA